MLPDALNNLHAIVDDYDPATADHADQVRLAQELLCAAIDILADVAGATRDDHARAYVIDHLRILASDGHGFLSGDYNLDQWIEKLEDADDDADH